MYTCELYSVFGSEQEWVEGWRSDGVKGWRCGGMEGEGVEGPGHVI